MRKHKRTAAILIAVLASLMVIVLLGGAMVNSLAVDLRQHRQSARDLQAFWLAEAGLDRAVSKLAVDSEYREETWRIPADEMQIANPAVVQITLEEKDGSTWLITSEASFGQEEHPTRRRLTRVIPAEAAE